MMLLGGLSVNLWCIQTELEQGQKWELNQHKWVIRHYVILSQCNGNWKWTGNLGNGTHFGTYMETLQWNL